MQLKISVRKEVHDRPKSGAIKNLKMPKKVRQGGQNWGKTTSKLELKTFFARNGKSFFQSKLHQIFWLSAPSDGSLYIWLHIASFILDPAFDYFAFVFCDFLISNSVKLSVIIGVTKNCLICKANLFAFSPLDGALVVHSNINDGWFIFSIW